MYDCCKFVVILNVSVSKTLVVFLRRFIEEILHVSLHFIVF